MKKLAYILYVKDTFWDDKCCAHPEMHLLPTAAATQQTEYLTQ